MKDYRLSEIRDAELGEFCAEGDTIGAHLENDLLLQLHEHFNDWCNIEPRDMIELPCKMPYNAGDTCEVRYVVLYMKDNGDVSITNGYTEAQADTVLEQLRGGDKK